MSFKQIKNFPDYEITDTGIVVSTKFNKRKQLKPGLDRHGYLKVELWVKGKAKSINIHRLVAIHFIPNPEGLSDVDHIDQNKLNNNLNNLRWVTRSDNQRNGPLRKDNTSGYQGVARSVIKAREYWRAYWCDENKKPKVKSFRIDKFGEEEAKAMAIVHRRKMVDLLYNRVNLTVIDWL